MFPELPMPEQGRIKWADWPSCKNSVILKRGAWSLTCGQSMRKHVLAVPFPKAVGKARLLFSSCFCAGGHARALSRF